jgi:hypothetical protein
MTATSLATLPTRSKISGRARPQVVDGHMEFTFDNISDLCAFVAKEIAFSRKKYSTFAKDIGMCHGTVSNMAKGVTQHPRAETVFQMLKALGYEVVVRS